VTNIHFTSVTPHAKHKYKREMGFTGGHIRKNLLQRYPNKDMRQLSTLHTLPTIMHELSTFFHYTLCITRFCIDQFYTHGYHV